MELTVADQMVYTTVKLTCFKDGAAISTGTGFFWRVTEGAGFVELLITNKHVVDGADRIEMICHVATPDAPTVPSGGAITISLEIDPTGLFPHPDAAIDLVGLGLSGIFEDAEKRGFPPFIRTLSSSNVPVGVEWSSFDAIEDVLMVGCPNGLYDEVNFHPLVRRGITATNLAKPYNGKQEFLVDMACFPGSSGSPVFINQVGYTDRATGRYVLDGRRFHLVGVLHAGPVIRNQGVLRLGAQPTFEVASMMHLGQVIRADALLAINQLVLNHLGPPPKVA